jgi:hypothetical protein
MFPNCRIYDLTVPARLATRDVRPFVTRREAGCDGRKGLFDETGPRVRSSRVVPIPRRWDQVVQLAMSALRARHAEICAAMVAKEPGRQGEHGVSRKAIAQGVPCDFGPA